MIEKENDHLSKAIKITRNEDKFTVKNIYLMFFQNMSYIKKRKV